MNLYRDESSNPKWNAQRNLSGRTHYVDDDTLRFHHARILRTHITDDGLLFALIESVALDPNNHTRGFRHVIFDVFGNTISRSALHDCVSTRKAAEKAMWNALNEISAIQVTREGIEREERNHKDEMDRARKTLAKLATPEVAQ